MVDQKQTETLRNRVIRVEDCIIKLNQEMGLVQGELKWIKWLMGFTTAGVLGQLVIKIIGG